VVMSSSSYWGTAWQFTLIYVLLVLVVGAALFWIIRNFVRTCGWPICSPSSSCCSV